MPRGPGSNLDEDLSRLLDSGFEYIAWDGIHPRPLLDGGGVVFACLVGRPDDPTFDNVCRNAYAKIVELGERYDAHLNMVDRESRRGSFPALNFGITHGKGTKRPVNLRTGRGLSKKDLLSCIDEIIASEDFRTLASFASYALSVWAPNLYHYYKTELDRLWEKEPDLLQNFLKSVFACATVNFGPKVWTRRHRDSMNCAFGMCAIQALGDFDHTQGGHLVLPDLKLVIEFPSGSTILIPSATLTHSNVPIREGESRASFTQFCPGGLFRFIDNHFMTEKKLKSVNRAEYERLQSEKPNRWIKGLSLLSRMSDVVSTCLEPSS